MKQPVAPALPVRIPQPQQCGSKPKLKSGPAFSWAGEALGCGLKEACLWPWAQVTTWTDGEPSPQHMWALVLAMLSAEVIRPPDPSGKTKTLWCEGRGCQGRGGAAAWCPRLTAP